jgi:hypothetical protein
MQSLSPNFNQYFDLNKLSSQIDFNKLRDNLDGKSTIIILSTSVLGLGLVYLRYTFSYYLNICIVLKICLNQPVYLKQSMVLVWVLQTPRCENSEIQFFYWKF